MRYLRRRLIVLTAFTALLAAPTLLQAEQQASSNLLLPYFEVDLDGGVVTLFTVANASDDPAEFRMTLHTNWGIPVLTVPASLDGQSVMTVNLYDWIVSGRPPDGNLSPAELEHLQATLSGRRSEDTDLFYSKEVEPRLAVGYVKIEAFGFPRPDSLWGDYFIVDPFQDSAQGEALISLDAECSGACRRHALRYVTGGAFKRFRELGKLATNEGYERTSGTFRFASVVLAQCVCEKTGQGHNWKCEVPRGGL